VTTIEEDQFKLLKDEMKTNPEIDISFQFESNVFKIEIDDIIDYCYQKDENEIPFKYRLKNINKIVTGFVQKVLIKNCDLINYNSNIFRILNMRMHGKRLDKN
jgi:hypothetical protein